MPRAPIVIQSRRNLPKLSAAQLFHDMATAWKILSSGPGRMMLRCEAARVDSARSGSH
eukprot:CAMPEP_0194494862 /NCGR_PEP_ID=MMETSP0253-20130528/12637_1 /TAXON_ID=2966 /ORGANISM="Noctiluca scintillans" /LENGTH=57 /DNA_ID=CAMNT_0039336037 /DNA_START=15 /DNA_END=188 /DNA_ORIENTATION=-